VLSVLKTPKKTSKKGNHLSNNEILVGFILSKEQDCQMFRTAS
jgi:hypothetical protein